MGRENGGERKGKADTRLPCQCWRFLLSQLRTTDVDIGLLTDGCGGGCNVDLKCVWRQRKKRQIPSIRIACDRKFISHASCTFVSTWHSGLTEYPSKGFVRKKET